MTATSIVMEPDAGPDVIEDFSVEDRIDVAAMGLCPMAEIRWTQEGDGITLHAGSTTLTLSGVAEVPGPANPLGGPLLVTGILPEAESLALAPGDSLPVDRLPGLRSRPGANETGAAGALAYTVSDPWGIAELSERIEGGSDGLSESRLAITLDPRNDAPRAEDSSYLLTAGVPLDARDPRIALVAVDPEGDPVTFSLLEPRRLGSVALDADGGFVYTPESGIGELAAENDSFRHRVSDGMATAD